MAEQEAKDLLQKDHNSEEKTPENSLLQELNNNPAQFTRIMEILNQRTANNELDSASSVNDNSPYKKRKTNIGLFRLGTSVESSNK